MVYQFNHLHQLFMWEKIQQVWKIKDIRNKILFVVGALVIFRLVAHIPIPGVNLANLRQFLAGNQIFGLLDVFSGGTMTFMPDPKTAMVRPPNLRAVR